VFNDEELHARDEHLVGTLGVGQIGGDVHGITADITAADHRRSGMQPDGYLDRQSARTQQCHHPVHLNRRVDRAIGIGKQAHDRVADGLHCWAATRRQCMFRVAVGTVDDSQDPKLPSRRYSAALPTMSAKSTVRSSGSVSVKIGGQMEPEARFVRDSGAVPRQRRLASTKPRGALRIHAPHPAGDFTRRTR